MKGEIKLIDDYLDNGIIGNQVTLDEGNNLSLTYDGLLYKSGADAVFAHYGYGTRWTNKNTVRMMRTDNGFRANVPVNKTGTINMVFKDSAENWDNNTGNNYSFEVKTKQKISII